MTLEPGLRSVSRRERIWIITSLLLLALFVLIDGLIWMHVIPNGNAPDESNHARVIAFIAQYHRLPVLNRDIYLTPLDVLPDAYVTHPPAGYVISALLSGLPASNDMIHLRYGSLFCILLSIPFVFLSLRRLFPRQLLLQIGVTWICLCIPQVTFVSAYANSDAFGLLAGAIWVCASIAAMQERWTFARCVVWGAAAGLMILGRYQGYILLPLFALVALISQRRDPVGKIVWRNVVAVCACVLVAGWWLAFNIRTYHEILPIKTLWNAQMALGRVYLSPRDQGETYWSILTRSIWISSMFRSFFGCFDWMALLMPERVYAVLRWLVVLSWLGLAIGVVRKYFVWRGGQDDPIPGRMLCLAAFLLTPILLIFFMLHFSLTRAFEAQGRYLFPGLVQIIVLLVCGWRAFFPRRARFIVAPSMAVGCVALNVFAIGWVVIPYYKPLPPTSLIPDLQNVPATINTRVIRIYRHHEWFTGLFEQSPASVEITEKVQSPILLVDIGVMREVYHKCPAVRFILSVRQGQKWSTVFDRTLYPMSKPADQSWRAVEIDMSRYVNQTTQLQFTVDPAGDTAYDWAVWLNPRWSSKNNSPN